MPQCLRWLAALLAVCSALTAAHAAPPSPGDLHLAVNGNDVAQIQNLLQSGADIDARDGLGRTPLLVATHRNYVDAARVLIDAGANVNAKDQIADSPYLYAGARGYNAILQMTLAHGADLRSTNRYGGTALIPACERGHVDTVRLLIAAGVEVDHVNRLGWTCLLEAILLGDGGPQHQHIVQLLIAANANVNLADAQGVSPLAHARKKGHAEIVQLLLQAGAH